MKDKTRTGLKESDNSGTKAYSREARGTREYIRPFGAFIVKMIQQYVIPLTDCMCIIIIGPSRFLTSYTVMRAFKTNTTVTMVHEQVGRWHFHMWTRLNMQQVTFFSPQKPSPFVSVNMTYGARTFLGDIDWRQLCCHNVAGELLDPVFLKCDPCYKLSAHSVSLTWNLPLEEPGWCSACYNLQPLESFPSLSPCLVAEDWTYIVQLKM